MPRNTPARPNLHRRTVATRALQILLALLMAIPGALLAPSVARAYTSPNALWAGLTGTLPSARSSAAAAFDLTHNQTVVFGGTSGATALSDTWTFNGTTWSVAATAGPTARTDSVMAYSSLSGRPILFGGFDGTNYLNDTWTWTGSAWALWTPSGAVPPARSQATATAYNGGVLLQGGYNAAGFLNDTWFWGGSSWQQLTPTTTPPALAGSAAAETSDGKVILFGGRDGGGPVGQTWSYSLGNWTPLNPATSPGSRAGAVAALDRAGGDVVMAGGTASGVATASAWVWTGTTWVRTADLPSARTAATITAAADGSVLLTGGTGSSGAFGDAQRLISQPSAPTNVTAVPGFRQATISWQTPQYNGGTPVTGYTVTAHPSGVSMNVGAVTTTTMTSLIAQESYTFTVAAHNAVDVSGSSAPSAPVTIGDLPSPPTNVVATPADSTISVTWAAPASTNGSPVTGYTISWWLASAGAPCCSTPLGTQVLGATASAYTVGGLVNGNAYYIGVHATTQYGDGGSATYLLATPLAVPGSPTGVTVASGNAQISVAWTAPTNFGGAASVTYLVTPYDSGVAGLPVTTASTAVNVTGLTDGHTYVIHVATQNALWTSADAISSAATPIAPPPAPTSVQATLATDPHSLSVTWTPNSDTGGSPLTQFTVTAYLNGSVAAFQTVSPSTTTYTFTNLIEGDTYVVGVQATNQAGTSAETRSAALLLPTPPSVPQSAAGVLVNPTYGGDGQITVNWLAPASNGGGPLTGYVAELHLASGTLIAGATQTLPPTATSTTFIGLSNGTAYSVWLHATNSAGSSDVFYMLGIYPGLSPAPPTNAVISTREVMSWGASANDGGAPITATEIQGYFSSGYAGAVDVVRSGMVTSTDLTTVFPHLTPGATYIFKVAYRNDVGFSAWDYADAYTIPTTPAAPASVAATGGNATVTATWTAPTSDGGSPVSGYIVTLYTNGNAVTAATLGSGTLTYQFSGLPNGTTYVIHVSANNIAGSGSDAVSSTVTTQGPPSAPASVTATADNGAAIVHWQAPVSNGGTPITSYAVTAYEGTTVVSMVNVAGSLSTYTVPGLSNDHTYTIGVIATNAVGTGPETRSNSVVPGTPPPPTSDVYSTLISSDHPTLYYRFDEPFGHIAQNFSGNGQNLTYKATKTLGTAGGVGTADTAATATNDGVPLASGTVSGLPSQSQPWTAEIWTRTAVSGDQQLYSWGQPGYRTGVRALASNGGTRLSIDNGDNGGAAWWLPYSIDDNAWHVVAVAFDGTNTITAYVDGVRIGTGQVTMNLSNGALHIGDAYTGTLDEFAIYPAGLDESHVNAHWRVGQGNQVCPSNPLPDAYGRSVVAGGAARYYPLGDTARSVTDASGSCLVGAYASDATHPTNAPFYSGSVASGQIHPLVVGSMTGLAAGASPWTAEVWQRTGDTANHQIMVFGDPNGWRTRVELWVQNGGNTFVVGNGEWSWNVNAPYLVDDNVAWHQIALSYTGVTGAANDRTITLYLDGQAIGSTPMTLAVTSNGQLRLGGQYAGQLADFAFYPSALPDTALSAHWSANGGGSACPSRPTDTYGAAVVSSGPSLFYRMDESSGQVMHDSSQYSPNCRNGSYSSATTHAAASAPTTGGYAAVVAGTPAAFGSSGVLSGGASPFSAELWQKTSNTNNHQLFVYGDQNGWRTRVEVWVQGGGNTLVVGNGEWSWNVTAPYLLDDGTWHDVALSYTGVTGVANDRTMTLYVDGQAVGSTLMTLNVTLPGNGLVIGRVYTGSLAEFAYYQSAISAVAIGWHWRSSQAGTSCPAPPTDAYGHAVVTTVPAPNLYYPMGEASGRVMQDYSSNCQAGSYPSTTVPASDSPVPGGRSQSGAAGPVAFGSSVGLVGGSGAFTAELWQKAADTNNHQLFVYGDQNGWRTRVEVWVQGGGNTLVVGNGEWSWNVTTPYPIDEGGWHDVALSYTGVSGAANDRTMTVYLDGQAVGATLMTLNITLPGNGLVVGRIFNGSLAQFSYTPGVVSAADLGGHVRVGGTGTACPAAPVDPYGVAVTGAAPSLFYRMDDSAGRVMQDYSGNCRAGSYATATTHSADTALSSGMSAVTITGPLGLGSSDGVQPGGLPFTAELWQKSADTNNHQLLVYGDQNGWRTRVEVWVQGGGHTLVVGNGEWSWNVTTPYGIDDGLVWHDIALSYTGVTGATTDKTMTLYLDGQAIGSTLMTLNVTLPGNGLVLGRVDNGKIDEFAYYQKTLTSAQIDAHWQAASGAGCGLAPSNGYASTILGDHPTAYFPLDETSGLIAHDVAGSCHNGAYAGTATHVGDNPVGGAAARTDGTGAILSVGSSGAPLGPNDRTIETWIKTAAVAGTRSVAEYGDVSHDAGFRLELSGDSTLQISSGTTVLATATGPYPVDDLQWHLVTASYTARVVTIFVDGSPIGSTTLAIPLATAAGPLIAGGDIASGEPYAGELAQLAVYSAALTGPQVDAHWSASGHSFCGATPVDGYGALVRSNTPSLFYRMDETTGRVAKDSSGNCRAGAYGPTVQPSSDTPLTSGGRSASSTGGAPVLEGSTDGVQAAGMPFTAELWQKTNDSGNHQLFVYGDQSGWRTRVELWVQNGGNSIVVGNGEWSWNVSTPYGIDDGGWHDVTLRYSGMSNGATMTLFLDGQAIGSMPMNLNVTVPGNGLELGRVFTGSLDEFAYYPAALQTSDVDAHWRAVLAQAGCSAAPFNSYALSVLSDRPAAYFPMTETSAAIGADVSGHCSNAAYAGATSHTAPGVLAGDTAASESGGIVAIAPAAGLPDTTTDRAIEAWVNTTQTTGVRSIVSYGSLATAAGAQLRISGDSSLQLSDGTTTVSATSTYPVADGTWHQLIASDAGGTVTFFVDGLPIGTGTLTLNSNAQGTALYMGGLPGAGEAYSGALSHVAIYSGGLSASRVAAHWYESRHTVCGLVPRTGYGARVLADAPSLYYGMNETAGRVMQDSSGNCRTGAYTPGASHSTDTTLPDGGSARVAAGPVALGSSDGLNGAALPFTAEVWQKTADTGNHQIFVYGDQSGWRTRVEMWVQNGGNTIVVGNGEWSWNVPTPYVIADALNPQWHDIALRYSGSQSTAPNTMTLFLDGQAIGATTMVLNVTLPGNGLVLGRVFTGNLDDFAYYPTALTTERIDAHWRGADVAAAACDVTSSDAYTQGVRGDHPTFFYRMDGTSRTVADYAGNMGHCRTGAYAVDAGHAADPPTQVGAAVVHASAHTTVLGSSDGLQSGGASWSAEVWEKSSSTVDQQLFVYGAQGAWRQYLGVWAQSNGSRLTVGNGEWSWQPAVPFNLDDGHWHQVDLTYNGTTATIAAYEDGQPVGATAMVLNITLPGNGLEIAPNASGKVSDFSYYTTMLTGQQVNNHWRESEGLGCQAPTPDAYDQPVNLGQPVAYYPMGDTGRVVLDATGGCHAGADTGSVVHGSGVPVLANSAGGAVSGATMIASASNLPAGAQPRTIEFSFNTSSVADQTLLQYGNTATAGAYLSIRLTNGGTSLSVTTGNQTATATSPVRYQLANGYWHHIVVSTNGASTISFAVDGAAMGNVAIAALTTVVLNTTVQLGDGTLGQLFSQLAVYAQSLDLTSRPVPQTSILQGGITNQGPAGGSNTFYYGETEWGRLPVQVDHYEALLFAGTLAGATFKEKQSVCGGCTGTWFDTHINWDTSVIEVIPYLQADESAQGSEGIPAATEVTRQTQANPLEYFGGAVQDGTNVHMIYLNEGCSPSGVPSNCDSSDSTNYVDYNKTITDFIGGSSGSNGIGGTNYWSLMTQYYQSGNLGGQRRLPENRVSLLDQTNARADFLWSSAENTCSSRCLTDRDITQLIRTVQNTNSWTPDVNTTFVVVLGKGWGACNAAPGSECTTTGTCAWHFQSGNTVYAVIPFVATISGCNGTNISQQGLTQDQNAGFKANFEVAHELTEAATDPYQSGWCQDDSHRFGFGCVGTGTNPGGEIADMCGNQEPLALPNGLQYTVPAIQQNLFYISANNNPQPNCASVAAPH